jgi:hypothetical protein
MAISNGFANSNCSDFEQLLDFYEKEFIIVSSIDITIVP